MRILFLNLSFILMLCIQSFCSSIESELNALDPESRQKIIELISLAESKEVSRNLLERKLIEGVSKGVPGQLIYQAMQKRFDKIIDISVSENELESNLYHYEKVKSDKNSNKIKMTYVYGGNNDVADKPVKKKNKKKIQIHENVDVPVKPDRTVKIPKKPVTEKSEKPEGASNELEEKQLKLEKKQLEKEQKLNDKIERKLLKIEKKALKLEEKLNKKNK